MHKIDSSFPRKLLASSAWFAAFVGILSLVFSAYAHLSPIPKASLKERVNFIRAAVSPRLYLLEKFPRNSTVAQAINQPLHEQEYRFTTPTNSEIQATINKFVTTVYGTSYEDKKFEIWLDPARPLGLRWPLIIDDPTARTDDNVSLLIRSLLFDYGQRLTQLSQVLRSARKSGHDDASFDALIAPSPYENMPNFLSWFATTLNKTLGAIALEYQEKAAKKVSLKKLMLPALEAAAFEFLYAFVVLLFLRTSWTAFLVALALLVAIVASVATAWAAQKTTIGIGGLILAFMALIFVMQFGLFNMAIGRLMVRLKISKVQFNAFLPALFLIFLISFVDQKVSKYLLFMTMAMYAVALMYLYFRILALESSPAAKSDARLRMEWNNKLTLISRELPLNEGHDLALSLIGLVSSSSSHFTDVDKNSEISDGLDELLDILSLPTHNPYIVVSKLGKLKQLLLESKS